MANTNVPIPGSPLIFFFFITLGYLIFTLFSIQSAKSIDSIDKAKDGSMLTIIYVCILIIGSYFINTTVSKALCNSQAVRWTDILLATLLPWIIIFFTLFIVLKIFPGWVTPFSNTVGYLVISILGVETTLTAILNNNTNVDGDLAKAIANITHNKSNFINQIDINKTTFLNFIDELKKVGIIDLNKQELQDEVAIQQGGGPGEDAIGPHMAKGLETRKTEARASAGRAAAQEAQHKIDEKAEAAAAATARVATAASGAAFDKAARGAPAAAKPPRDHSEEHHRTRHRTSPGKHRGRGAPQEAAASGAAQREEAASALREEAAARVATAAAASKADAAALREEAAARVATAAAPAQGEAESIQTEPAEQDNTKPENNPDIQNLYKLLVIKNVIGQLTWYTLAGVLVCSVSYNYIINMSCEKSLEEITADLNNAEAESLEYAQESG